VSAWRKGANTPNDESHALLCPSLATEVVAPALKEGPAALKQAATDRAKLTQVIGDYKSARPKTSSAEVVEALSTAYCRAISSDQESEAQMSAQLADFAQRVASALGSHRTASSPTG
jgi:hypothetical protein